MARREERGRAYLGTLVTHSEEQGGERYECLQFQPSDSIVGQGLEFIGFFSFCRATAHSKNSVLYCVWLG